MLLFLWIGINGVMEDWRKIGRSHYRRQRACEERQSLIFAAITCLLAGVIMWCPAMIMCLSMNMSWAILWLQDSEDAFHEADYPFYSKVLRFLQGRDFTLKLQCVNLVTSRETLLRVANNTNAQKLRNIVNECTKEDFTMSSLRQVMSRVPRELASKKIEKFNQEPLGMGHNLGDAEKEKVCFKVKRMGVWTVAVFTVLMYALVTCYGLLYPYLTFFWTLSKHFDPDSPVDITHGAYCFQTILFIANVLILAWLVALIRPGGVVSLYIRSLWHLQPLQRKHGGFGTAAEWHEFLFRHAEAEYAQRSGCVCIVYLSTSVCAPYLYVFPCCLMM
jgi:hypothetical protein